MLDLTWPDCNLPFILLSGRCVLDFIWNTAPFQMETWSNVSGLFFLTHKCIFNVSFQVKWEKDVKKTLASHFCRPQHKYFVHFSIYFLDDLDIKIRLNLTFINTKKKESIWKLYQQVIKTKVCFLTVNVQY